MAIAEKPLKPPGESVRTAADQEAAIAYPTSAAWRSRSLRRGLMAAGALAMLGMAALTIDLPIARFLHGGGLPGDVGKALMLAEVFAHGGGVALIGLTIWFVDRAGRRYLLRILACAYGAGLAADGVKLLVSRTRPRAFNLEGSILDSFQGLLPIWHAGSDGQGFPSGHTATALGLALGLAWRYPQARGWFLVLAVMAAAQRMMVEAHFLSDTLWGAAIGCLVATLLLHWQRATEWLDRFEGSQPAPGMTG